MFILKYFKIQEETLNRYKVVDEQLNHLVNMDAIPKADMTYLKAVIASQKSYIKESELNFEQSKEFVNLSYFLTD